MLRSKKVGHGQASFRCSEARQPSLKDAHSSPVVPDPRKAPCWGLLCPTGLSTWPAWLVQVVRRMGLPECRGFKHTVWLLSCTHSWELKHTGFVLAAVLLTPSRCTQLPKYSVPVSSRMSCVLMSCLSRVD